MQSLDIISVNIWHILVSLINLVLIFLIVKKFLFKPVKKIIADRQAQIDSQFEAAAVAEKKANDSKAEWEERLKNADKEADTIIKDATDAASYRADQIIEQANSQAEVIKLRAENEIMLMQKSAEETIRREITEVSSAIAERMLEREINADDHKALIDSFINDIDNAK